MANDLESFDEFTIIISNVLELLQDGPLPFSDPKLIKIFEDADYSIKKKAEETYEGLLNVVLHHPNIYKYQSKLYLKKKLLSSSNIYDSDGVTEGCYKSNNKTKLENNSSEHLRHFSGSEDIAKQSLLVENFKVPAITTVMNSSECCNNILKKLLDQELELIKQTHEIKSLIEKNSELNKVCIDHMANISLLLLKMSDLEKKNCKMKLGFKTQNALIDKWLGNNNYMDTDILEKNSDPKKLQLLLHNSEANFNALSSEYHDNRNLMNNLRDQVFTLLKSVLSSSFSPSFTLDNLSRNFHKYWNIGNISFLSCQCPQESCECLNVNSQKLATMLIAKKEHLFHDANFDISFDENSRCIYSNFNRKAVPKVDFSTSLFTDKPEVSLNSKSECHQPESFLTNSSDFRDKKVRLPTCSPCNSDALSSFNMLKLPVIKEDNLNIDKGNWVTFKEDENGCFRSTLQATSPLKNMKHKNSLCFDNNDDFKGPFCLFDRLVEKNMNNDRSYVQTDLKLEPSSFEVIVESDDESMTQPYDPTCHNFGNSTPLTDNSCDLIMTQNTDVKERHPPRLDKDALARFVRNHIQPNFEKCNGSSASSLLQNKKSRGVPDMDTSRCVAIINNHLKPDLIKKMVSPFSGDGNNKTFSQTNKLFSEDCLKLVKSDQTKLPIYFANKNAVENVVFSKGKNGNEAADENSRNEISHNFISRRFSLQEFASRTDKLKNENNSSPSDTSSKATNNIESNNGLMTPLIRNEFSKNNSTIYSFHSSDSSDFKVKVSEILDSSSSLIPTSKSINEKASSFWDNCNISLSENKFEFKKNSSTAIIVNGLQESLATGFQVCKSDDNLGHCLSGNFEKPFSFKEYEKSSAIFSSMEEISITDNNEMNMTFKKNKVLQFTHVNKRYLVQFRIVVYAIIAVLHFKKVLQYGAELTYSPMNVMKFVKNKIGTQNLNRPIPKKEGFWKVDTSQLPDNFKYITDVIENSHVGAIEDSHRKLNSTHNISDEHSQLNTHAWYIENINASEQSVTSIFIANKDAINSTDKFALHDTKVGDDYKNNHSLGATMYSQCTLTAAKNNKDNFRTANSSIPKCSLKNESKKKLTTLREFDVNEKNKSCLNTSRVDFTGTSTINRSNEELDWKQVKPRKIYKRSKSECGSAKEKITTRKRSQSESENGTSASNCEAIILHIPPEISRKALMKPLNSFGKIKKFEFYDEVGAFNYRRAYVLYDLSSSCKSALNNKEITVGKVKLPIMDITSFERRNVVLKSSKNKQSQKSENEDHDTSKGQIKKSSNEQKTSPPCGIDQIMFDYRKKHSPSSLSLGVFNGHKSKITSGIRHPSLANVKFLIPDDKLTQAFKGIGRGVHKDGSWPQKDGAFRPSGPVRHGELNDTSRNIYMTQKDDSASFLPKSKQLMSLVQILCQIFPVVPMEELTQSIADVRQSNGNSLSGMSYPDLVKAVFNDRLWKTGADDARCCLLCADLLVVRDTTVLVCFHSFHKECLNGWSVYIQVCPICHIPICQLSSE